MQTEIRTTTDLDAEKTRRYELTSSSQQLFAVIKCSSKYYGQSAPGERFHVFVDAKSRDAYRVIGGPGGRYRLCDVSILVGDGDCAIPIS